MLLGLTMRVHIKAALVALSVVTLYLLGARSEFFGFLFVLIISGIISMLRSGLTAKILFFLMFILVALLFYAIQGSEYANRQLEVFKLAESSSISRRLMYLREGWEYLKLSPILGDYAGQLREGSFGSYTHNALSAWRQFGIVGFSLYFGLSVFSLYTAVRKVVFFRNITARCLVTLYINSYVFILIVAAKSVFDIMAPFAWGLSVNAFAQKHFRSSISTLKPDRSLANSN
jgi:hypothetical protein